MSIVLGIDIGTQSVKAVVYDGEKKACAAAASSPLDMLQKDEGIAEQLTEWWVEALQKALHQIDQKIRKKVSAIGVSGQQHGFVPLSYSHEVLAPVKLWCDTSTIKECDLIMSALGGVDACINQIGNPVLPGYTASKIRWFRDNEPDSYKRMATILLPHDYINLYLTGETRMEAGDASGTGFLNIFTRQWSREMLQAIDPTRDLYECLPSIELENTPIGSLLPRVASELGLPENIPVSIGGGDNMMAAVGTGNVEPGAITMSLGTSGTVYGFSETPIVDPKGEFAGFCSSSGGWLPLVCTMNCTGATELLRTLFKIDLEGFELCLNKSTPGAKGLITVPFFTGERTPNLPNAKACLLGLDDQNTGTNNILRSAVEGVTYGLKYGLGRLADHSVRAETIILTGGGAKSDAWRQIVADICGAPVEMLQQEEGAAFGAALQALAMLEERELTSLVKEHLDRDSTRCCEPDPSTVTFYDEAYFQYRQSVEQIASIYGN